MRKKKAFMYKGFNLVDWRIAKKTYICKCCKTYITPGTKYLRAYGKCDYLNQFYDYSYCEECGKGIIVNEVDI